MPLDVAAGLAGRGDRDALFHGDLAGVGLDGDLGGLACVGQADLDPLLPERFGEFPVRFPVTWDSSVSHKVEVATVAGFAASRLGVDPTGTLSVLDWLSVTGQSVLEVIAGPVFTDRTHTLVAVRTQLAWYPPDVERYVLAAGWQRLCQSLPMVGRTAEAGEELGSRLLSAGPAGDLLWLAFALSRRSAPYAKWRGTAFRSLPVAATLGPLLDAAAADPPGLMTANPSTCMSGRRLRAAT